MKKDKEWLKQAIRGMCQSRVLQSMTIKVDVLDNLINQLEEPEQEKVVVPKFVDDWITNNWLIDKYVTLERFMCDYNSVDLPTELYNYYDNNKENSRDKVINGILDGYTVEKEKLYRVKVDQGPNYLYVESLHLYKDVVEPLDFNHKFSVKDHALKFTSRNQAKGVAELVGGEIEEITK